MTDLLLGSDIGMWVLTEVDPETIGTVFTLEPAIEATAAAMGIRSARAPSAGGASPVRRALSVHYPRILREPILESYAACYNLHPSYLPWGRGWWAVTWAIWAGEPAGASLHRMSPEVDAGPLVERVRVDVLDDDTGGSLLRRVRAAERSLFQAWWPLLSTGMPIPEVSQPPGGSHHSREEVSELKRQLPAMPIGDASRLQRALDFS